MKGSLVTAGVNGPVVPASVIVEALKRIKKSVAALGRKALETASLKSL